VHMLSVSFSNIHSGFEPSHRFFCDAMQVMSVSDVLCIRSKEMEVHIDAPVLTNDHPISFQIIVPITSKKLKLSAPMLGADLSCHAS
jgi:hypothetical protein